MIVYNILAHEQPACVFDLVQNIAKFNVTHEWRVIVNYSNYLNEAIGHWKMDNVIVCPRAFDKHWHTYSLLQGLVENWLHVKQIGLTYSHMMFFASNCMFVTTPPNFEQFDMWDPSSTIEDFKAKTSVDYQETWNTLAHYEGIDDWHWNFFTQNKKITSILNNLPCARFSGAQWEGVIYSQSVADTILGFIHERDLGHLVNQEMCFEEFILPTLEQTFFQSFAKRLCHVAWNREHLTPTVDDIAKIIEQCRAGISEQCMVKRIPRDLDNPLRRLVNNL